jgi:hypothetical protein
MFEVIKNIFTKKTAEGFNKTSEETKVSHLKIKQIKKYRSHPKYHKNNQN